MLLNKIADTTFDCVCNFCKNYAYLFGCVNLIFEIILVVAPYYEVDTFTSHVLIVNL